MATRPIRIPLPALGLVAGVTIAVVATGCHRPQGALMSYTGESYTYFSYQTLPKTVRVRDVRTGEIVFAMDIPTGKQLTIQFKPGDGDDSVHRPDLLLYQVMDMGKTTGKLRNAMSVPGASTRLIEVDVREGVEFVQASPDREFRTDELQDRPDWWTPEGGELPEDDYGMTIYDD
jgi:hypothetical protein